MTKVRLKTHAAALAGPKMYTLNRSNPQHREFKNTSKPNSIGAFRKNRAQQWQQIVWTIGLWVNISFPGTAFEDCEMRSLSKSWHYVISLSHKNTEKTPSPVFTKTRKIFFFYSVANLYITTLRKVKVSSTARTAEFGMRENARLKLLTFHQFSSTFCMHVVNKNNRAANTG